MGTICHEHYNWHNAPSLSCPYCKIVELEQQLEGLRERMAQIHQWCEAYPNDIFPEPTSEDWKALNKLCKEHLGHGIDRYSASNMRYVVTGIAKHALPPSKG